MSSMPGGQDDSASYAPQSAGSKQIKCEHLPKMGVPASIGPAGADRIYTKDYSKVKEQGDKDDVTAFLGNPLRW